MGLGAARAGRGPWGMRNLRREELEALGPRESRGEACGAAREGTGAQPGGGLREPLLDRGSSAPRL